MIDHHDLPDRLLAVILSRDLVEFTPNTLRAILPARERPSLQEVKDALATLHDRGEVYLMPPPPMPRRGIPRPRVWRLAEKPLPVETVRREVIREWRSWARNEMNLNGAEVTGLYIKLQIVRPELLCWRLKPNEERESSVSTWIRKWVDGQRPQAEVSS